MKKQTVYAILVAFGLGASACQDKKPGEPASSGAEPAAEVSEPQRLKETPVEAKPSPEPMPVASEASPVLPVDGLDISEYDPENPFNLQPVENPPNAVVINPESLRYHLLERNIGVKLALNRLHQAKTQVSMARAHLLPSINLGALVLSPANPAFALSSIEFLVPFLLPHKWFEHQKAKNLLKAERSAYRAMRLNEYASAYSLYYTVLGDLQLKQMLDQQLDDVSKIAAVIERSYQAGLSSLEDLNRARAELSRAQISVSRTEDLIIQEKAALKHALGLDLTSELALMPSEMSESKAELAHLQESHAIAFDRAPERDQLFWLEKAAKSEKWSKIFGFMNSATLRSPGGGGGGEASVSLNDLHLATGFNLGFTTFPAVKMTRKNRREIELRHEELRLELSEALEVAVKQIAEAKRREKLSDEAYSSISQVYQTKLRQYSAGLASLVSVLRARTEMEQAMVEKLRVKTQLNLLRVTLHRSLLTDQFDLVNQRADQIKLSRDR